MSRKQANRVLGKKLVDQLRWTAKELGLSPENTLREIVRQYVDDYWDERQLETWRREDAELEAAAAA